MLFSFRDSATQAQSLYSLSNRTSLAMTQAQLSIGNYTLPRNKYLLYDCATPLSTANFTYMNQINFWMSAMKYFGLGIDRDVACSTY